LTEASTTASAALARECAQIQTRFRGRGPRRTRVFFCNPEVIVVLMEDTLTTADKSLVADGKADIVDQVRGEFQATMEIELVAAVERVTGGKVHAFIGGNRIDPDMSVEVFVLTPPNATRSELASAG
jgi:uncharacterized protein YbcI